MPTDRDRTARALVGGLFGAIPAWLIGFEGAALTTGVVEPLGRRLETAKRAGHPARVWPPAGTIWHGWVARHGYLPTRWGPVFGHPYLVLGALALGLGFGGLVAAASVKASGVSSWGGPGARGRGQFGTAHWRPTAALAASYTHWQAPVTREKGAKSPRLQTQTELAASKAGPGPVGLLVGADTLQNPLAGWILERDEHALVLGSTRSGKTRRLILPSIGIIGATAGESLVISDPKGELYDHSAEWLESRGYRVWRIDLIRPRPSATHRFNPVAPVWTALHQDPPDLALAAKIARQVAHIITHGAPGSLGGSDPLWINGQVSLTAAVILAVADQAPTVESANLAASYRLLVNAGSMDEGKMLDAVFENVGDPAHPARLAYATYQLAQGKTRASIIVTAAAGLQLWGDPEIAWVTADQDHDLASIADTPTAIFLVIPHEDASRYTAAGLYISSLFRTLTDIARRHGGRLPRRVTFLLDEFGNLPPLPDFDQTVTVSAGMGIRLVVALQNIEQLRKHYQHVERTIRGNLGTWLFLRTSDLQTAKELTEMIGRYTLHSESTQAPKVGWLTSTSGVGHTSQGLSLTGRELVTTDELMRWPQDMVLVWQAGYPPAKLPLPDLSAWSIFRPISERRPWTPPDSPLPAVAVWDPLREGPSLTGAGGVPVWEGADALTHGLKGGEETVTVLTVEELGVLGPLFAEGQEAPIAPDDEGPAFTEAAN